jgi:hypothetical protein
VRLFQRFMPVTRCTTRLLLRTRRLVRDAAARRAARRRSGLLFAIDSLPAVIAVTGDPFIAFS